MLEVSRIILFVDKMRYLQVRIVREYVLDVFQNPKRDFLHCLKCHVKKIVQKRGKCYPNFLSKTGSFHASTWKLLTDTFAVKQLHTRHVEWRYAVAVWYGAGLAIARSWVRIPPVACCVPTPTQRVIPPESVNEYQWSWGVNGHTTWCTSPVSVVLWLRLVSGWGLRPKKRRSATPYESLRIGKGLYFTYMLYIKIFKMFIFD